MQSGSPRICRVLVLVQAARCATRSRSEAKLCGAAVPNKYHSATKFGRSIVIQDLKRPAKHSICTGGDTQTRSATMNPRISRDLRGKILYLRIRFSNRPTLLSLASLINHFHCFVRPRARGQNTTMLNEQETQEIGEASVEAPRNPVRSRM